MNELYKQYIEDGSVEIINNKKRLVTLCML